ncbi:MAG: hypothetical protein EOP55_21705, partial [Sphingobacteriales bacterium]
EAININEKQWSAEYRFLLENGSYADILDRGYILQDEYGTPYRMIGSMLDITDLNDARKNAESSAQDKYFLAQSMPLILWTANPEGSVDFIKSEGKVINQNRLDKNDKRARHQQAAVVINDGKLNLKKWDGTAIWEQNLSEKDVMNSGPLLIFNDETEVLDTTAFTKLRHPRSAIGIKPNGKIILLTVDGRQENAAGMSLHELTKIMIWLGCTSAINLDGGGSTALWVKDATENGVVNYPSDNKKWDHEGARKVANVVLLKGKQ